MGSASSKAVRSYPKSKPTWAGARTEIPSEINLSRASEVKTPAIEQDARDPHFLSNLAKIGQVTVPYASTAFQATDPLQQSIKLRQASEIQAASVTPTRNKLLAPDLSDYLDARKEQKSPADLQALASKYSVDPSILAKLEKYINTPSIGETTTSRKTTADGEQMMLMKAAWVDPRSS